MVNYTSISPSKVAESQKLYETSARLNPTESREEL